MKTLLKLFVCFLVPACTMAQEKGIHFETGLTWEQVKSKAKAENKYIFVDCFSKYCRACVVAKKTIYPKGEVGTFFNQHFLNVEMVYDKVIAANDIDKRWDEES